MPGQPRVAMRQTGKVLEARNAALRDGGVVKDMRQIMAQMEQTQALQEAEEATRRAMADAAATAGVQVPEKTEGKPEKGDEAEEDEVPKCHLHRKPNKACRFCKLHSAFLDRKTAKKEAAKQEVLKEIHEALASGVAKVDRDQRILLPNFAHFPIQLKERILSNRSYDITISEYSLHDCEDVLSEAESCDTETQREDMYFIPSSWIMCVYRILMIRPYETEFQALLNHKNIMVRCAAYSIVRIGMHQDRYWELLAPGLMDDEEFNPFPQRDARNYTVGEYVQKLLSEDRYCDEALPRISINLRKTINERFVMYGQFRKRYQANLEVLGRYEAAGVPVEVCKELDGEWVNAKTVGAKSHSKRCISIPVRFENGTIKNVSIGMIITVDANADHADLTKSRGQNNKELLEKLRQEQKEGVVMGHKEAFSGPGKLGKRKKAKDDDEEDEEAYALQEAKKRKNQEREREMAQIMQKYCVAGASSSKGGNSSAGDVDAPDHMRLG